MKHLLIAAGVLLPLAAQAGTVAVTVTTAAGAKTMTIDLPDAALARIAEAQRAALAKRGATSTLTDPQALAKIVSDAFDRAAARAMGYERAQAARAAKIAPIVVPAAQ